MYKMLKLAIQIQLFFKSYIPPRNTKGLYLQPLDQNCYDITAESCDCPVGKGPLASCKNVGTLCYALVEFCASGNIPEFLTCTDRLQQWNKPRT